MKMKKLIVSLVCGAVFYCLCADSAWALPPFKKAFDLKFVKKSGNDALIAEFKKKKCFTCHIKGKKKTHHNAFGEELEDLIEGNAKKRLKAAREAGNAKDEKAKLLKELDAAFDKVIKMKAESGQTYEEMFKEGKLP